MNKGAMIRVFIIGDLAVIVFFIIGIMQVRGNGDLFSNPIVYFALGLFILVPLVVLLARFRQGDGASNIDLLRTGTSAYATVIEVGDMRSLTNGGKARVGLKLQINPPDGTYFEARTTAIVSSPTSNPYYTGMMVKVRYDPKNPKRVVIDDGSAGAAPAVADAAPSQASYQTQVNVTFPQGSDVSNELKNLQDTFKSGAPAQVNPADLANLPPYMQKILQTVLADADHNGIPDIMEKGGMNPNNVQVINLGGVSGRTTDPRARIEKLEKLRAAGMISQEQFDMLKNLIEKTAQQGPG
jgi:hypothetical protein